MLRALLLLTVALPQAAYALASFGDRSTWEAAVGSWSTETFTSTPLQEVPFAGGTIDASGFSILVPRNHGGIGIFDGGSIDGTRYFRGDSHGDGGGIDPDYIHLVFDVPVHGFGIDVGDLFNEPEQPAELTFLIDGETLVAGPQQFFGVTSAGAFDTVRIGADFFYFDVDNVSFAAVPEPGSALLLGLGLATLSSRRRSRSCLRAVRRNRSDLPPEPKPVERADPMPA